MGAYAGSMWLRMWTGGRLLLKLNELSAFIKCVA